MAKEGMYFVRVRETRNAGKVVRGRIGSLGRIDVGKMHGDS